MKRLRTIRLVVAAVSISASCCAAGAQMLPAGGQKPSAAVPLGGSSLPAVGPTASDIPAVVERPHLLDVSYQDGKLSVEASNASLNQILREICGKTGIKVNGGVRDERVFGHYGPASTANILALLLEGTGSNMLLVDGAGGGSELVLTPRVGGASPPSANAIAADTDYSTQPRPDLSSRYPRPPSRQFRPPSAIPSSAEAQAPVGDAPPVAAPAVAVEEPAAVEQSTPPPANPNAGRTPQQIYDQLQNMLQQKQQGAQPQ